MSYETIKIERDDGAPYALVLLNSAQERNKLSEPMMRELASALDELEADADIGCILLSGSGKHFSTGARVSDFRDMDFIKAYKTGAFSGVWDRAAHCRKPIIAAVNGMASGAGLELAMMCDYIIAAADARFSQPEVNMGSVPASGGAHRLARLVGKSKAMEMCLTGREIAAEEAERSGLVARVVPADDLLEEAKRAALSIAGKSQPVVMMVKECVAAADESFLSQGVLLERRLCHASYSLEDQKEGMEALIEKRTPNFKQR